MNRDNAKHPADDPAFYNTKKAYRRIFPDAVLIEITPEGVIMAFRNETVRKAEWGAYENSHGQKCFYILNKFL